MSNLVVSTVNSSIIFQKTVKIAAVLALLCMAFFIFAPTITKSYIYKIFREGSKVQMLWQTRGWQEIQGSHFIVRYHPHDDKNAELVLSTAEEGYQPVVSKFGFNPKEKTLIVVYPTKESLGRSFGWTADESAMGVYWAGVIRVLSPTLWINETNPEKVKKIFETEGPVVHEFTHLMVDYQTGGNYTRWFTEGIAQYEEEKLTGYQLEERDVKHPGELYPFSKMDADFDRLTDQGLAYYQSLQAVNYIVDRYGEEGLRKVLDDLGKGNSMDKSFSKNLGLSMDQFESNFKKWAVVNG